MDEQHAVLMDTLNDIRLTMVRGQGREHVSDALKRVIEFTRMHFASEEQLMDEHGFPGAAEHREAHKKLLVQIEDAALRAQHNGELHLKSFLQFLREWYLNHIEEMDIQYGAWLNTRGIS